MVAVDGEAVGLDRSGRNFDRQPFRAVNPVLHFAFMQVFEHTFGLATLDPQGPPLAGPAQVEAQHQAGTLKGATILDRINAQRPVIAPQQGRLKIQVGKSGPPHQRPVTEYPDIAVR